MFEFLAELDKVLFILINDLLANPVTNTIMPIITSDKLLRAVFLVIIMGLLWKGNRQQRWLVLFAGVTLALTDQTAAGFLKPLIERARPCHIFDPEDINLLVGCGSGFSMPSAHAANTFGQAALLSPFVKWARWPLYLFAVLVALSRVFVGVHFPGDILVGALLGFTIGKIVAALYRLLNRKVFNPPVRPESDESPAEKLNEESATDAG